MRKKLITGLLLAICLIVVLEITYISVKEFHSSAPQNLLVKHIQNSIGSVVHIVSETRRIQGSGVAWTEDIIVTARHIVEGSKSFEITLNNGMRIKTESVLLSKKYDIAFIKIDKKILQPTQFGSVKETLLGQSLYVIGSPHGKINFNAVSLGIVSGLDRNHDFTRPYTNEKYGWSVAFTTDSATHPGNSGCPIFTMDGKVRGIIVGVFSPVLAICMPADLFMYDLESVKIMFEQQKFYTEKEFIDNSMFSSFTSKGEPFLYEK